MPHAKGEPENPVPRSELIAKFVDLAEVRLGRSRADVLASEISRLDEAPGLDPLGKALR